MSKLTGKVAVVTGASKGIGAAIAKTLAANGAAIVVNYASSKAGADQVVESITGVGGKAVAVHGDVSKPADANSIIDAAIAAFGRLDILVNNAGVYEFGPVETITEDQFRRMFDINVLGLLLISKAAAAQLGEGGSIINISSGVTAITPPQTVVYTALQGRGGRHHRRVGKGARSSENSGQHGQPQPHRDGGHPQCRYARLRLRGRHYRPDPARTSRSTSGHRRCCGLCGLGRCTLAHRRKDFGRWRSPVSVRFG